MPIYTSSSDSEHETTPVTKLFGRQRPVHAVLGGGKVADVLLWKNTKVSAALLIGVTLIWFLFEIVEYNFVTLFCHISMTSILLVFIWSRVAEFFNWKDHRIPEIKLVESTMREIASTFHARFDQILSKLINVACGKDHPGHFILTICSLYILSVIGNCFSFVNLLFLVLLSIETLPFLYNRYEKEVDRLVYKAMRRVRKMFNSFDSQVLNKIPRGPIKDKKKY
ncbi:hypothetical protein Dsin_005134 [Dipteronia sinensis]|uniref:Reticulon-like protein n=1 Tax=Dipteronia sinensis TaxID=43782 RepID=A0AAE0AWB2_9ROSI|nr:hypothetical protein Dsin_005134 [Dipteronia sinensis]